MSSHSQIQHLVAEYCWSMHDHDVDRITALFTENATIRFRGDGSVRSQPINGRDEIGSFFASVFAALSANRDHTSLTHCAVNPLIEAAGATATARFDFFAYAFVGGRPEIVIVGQYNFPRLVRTDGSWQIQQMEYVIPYNAALERADSAD